MAIFANKLEIWLIVVNIQRIVIVFKLNAVILLYHLAAEIVGSKNKNESEHIDRNKIRK